jgi:hypothetical protein
MQRVVIIPETEFSSLVAKLEKLEAQVQASTVPQEDRVHTGGGRAAQHDARRGTRGPPAQAAAGL